jgi:hypothetical protein
MKIIKQSLTTFFYSCFPNKSCAGTTNGTTMSTFWENNSTPLSLGNGVGDIPLVNIAPVSKSINTMDLDNIFLINKPSTYSNMLDSFINYHGPNSSQVKSLISPEMDLADRAYNVHLITGSNTEPLLLNTLKNKSSLSKLLDTPVSSNTLEEATSIDLSMIGVDRFLQDYSEGVKIALDLIS